MGGLCSKRSKDESGNNIRKGSSWLPSRKSSAAAPSKSAAAGNAAVESAQALGTHASELQLHKSASSLTFSGDHTLAGWPSWLTNVAAEAVQGWLPRRADSFEKLEKIGQGTYSNVYKARDLNNSGKMVALKKVRFVNMDPESVRFMAREIRVLRMLDHPNVIKLDGIVTAKTSQSIYLVFDHMEHDLAGLSSASGSKFTEPQVKCFMQQLFLGLDHCHSRGILHRDIKGSNLLVDGNGVLKIGDFGLATMYGPNRKAPLTSRVVTLWYRPPELLLGATDYGVAVDMWSAGCILAELLAGKPIMPGRTEVEQLHKIFKLCGSPSEEFWDKLKLPDAAVFKPQSRYSRRVADTFRDFPPSALALLETLLALDPAARGTAATALQSQFFTTEPLPCDPSELPRRPPSKEYDAKLREQEARRQRKPRGSESVRPRRELRPRASRDDFGGDSQAKRQSMQRRPEKLNAKEEGAAPPPRFRLELLDDGEASEHETKHRNRIPGRSCSSVRVSNAPNLRSQRSYAIRPRGTGGGASTRASARGGDRGNQSIERTASTLRGGDVSSRDLNTGHGGGGKTRRMHCSGPLVGGSVEDMLKEHERVIQQAVRNARSKEKA